MSDFMKKLFYTFRMWRRETRPCHYNGTSCRDIDGEDDYGSWRSGCSCCRGKGTYTHVTYYHVGHLMKGVVDALWCERAFQEGYSAAITDAKAPRKRT